MKKSRLVFLIICFWSAITLGDADRSSKASFDRFQQSVIFGVGAGALCGIAAITNFKTNFSKNSDPQNVFRGMSYGLYAGILLGLYLTFHHDKSYIYENPDYRPDIENPPADSQYRIRIRDSNKFRLGSFIPVEVSPILSASTVTGLWGQWNVFLF